MRERYRFVDFVGKYERLADALVTVLRLVSEEFDEQALRSQPPVHVSLKQYGEPVWEEELKAQILALEAPTMDRFWGHNIGIPRRHHRRANDKASVKSIKCWSE